MHEALQAMGGTEQLEPAAVCALARVPVLCPGSVPAGPACRAHGSCLCSPAWRVVMVLYLHGR